MATPGGSLLLEPGAASSLTRAARRHARPAVSTIGDDGYYHVELDGPHGEHVTASPKFTIDAIEDQPPTVSFEKPKRDIKANPVEEVFLQARADDDFGVKQLDLIYSVNGGAEKTVILYGKGAKAADGGQRRPHRLSRGAGRQARRLRLVLREGDRYGHGQGTEDHDERHLLHRGAAVQPGLPAGAVAGGRRRRRRGRRGGSRTRPARSPNSSGRSSAATFNVDRDKPKMAADKFKENTVFVGLSQCKLREQVEELSARCASGSATVGSDNMQEDRRDPAEGRRPR